MHTSSTNEYKLDTIRDKKRAFEKLIEPLPTSSDRGAGSSTSNTDETSGGTKRKRDNQDGRKSDDEDDEQQHDEVRLWEDGFKDRYYESKFDVKQNNLEFRSVGNCFKENSNVLR